MGRQLAKKTTVHNHINWKTPEQVQHESELDRLVHMPFWKSLRKAVIVRLVLQDKVLPYFTFSTAAATKKVMQKEIEKHVDILKAVASKTIATSPFLPSRDLHCLSKSAILNLHLALDRTTYFEEIRATNAKQKIAKLYKLIASTHQHGSNNNNTLKALYNFIFVKKE